MNGHGPAANGKGPDEATSRRLGRRRFSRKPAAVVAEPGGNEGVAAVRAELMLLREENARLKAERHHPPRVATLLGNAALPAASPSPEDDSADELAQLLTDYVVMRETLLVACDELDGALTALRARLEALPMPTPHAGAAIETDAGSAELRAALATVANGNGHANGNGNGNGNGRVS